MAHHRNALTLHHLFPTTRGVWHNNNGKYINEVLHYAWHFMVDDAIPEEVLQDFLDIWWPDEQYTVIAFIGQTGRIYTRQTQRVPWCWKAPSGYDVVFPNCRPLEVAKLWLWRWVPTDYFSHLVFQTPTFSTIIEPHPPEQDLLDRHDAIQRRVLDQAYHRWRTTGRWWNRETSFSIHLE